MASLKDGLKNLEKFCQDSWHRPGTSWTWSRSIHLSCVFQPLLCGGV